MTAFKSYSDLALDRVCVHRAPVVSGWYVGTGKVCGSRVCVCVCVCVFDGRAGDASGIVLSRVPEDTPLGPTRLEQQAMPPGGSSSCEDDDMGTSIASHSPRTTLSTTKDRHWLIPLTSETEPRIRLTLCRASLYTRPTSSRSHPRHVRNTFEIYCKNGWDKTLLRAYFENIFALFNSYTCIWKLVIVHLLSLLFLACSTGLQYTCKLSATRVISAPVTSKKKTGTGSFWSTDWFLGQRTDFRSQKQLHNIC